VFAIRVIIEGFTVANRFVDQQAVTKQRHITDV